MGLRSRSTTPEQTDKPKVLPTNMFLDQMIKESVGPDDSGIPEGSHISISGVPGAYKSTLGLQLLNGLGQNPQCSAVHYDLEQGAFRSKQMHARLHLNHIPHHFSDEDIEGPNVLAHMMEKSTSLRSGYTLAVLIDSFNHLLPRETDKEKRALAEQLRSLRKTHPNILLITINHLTKSGAVGGPAEIQQKPDVLISLKKKNGFVYLTTPKNRLLATDAPEQLKLTYEAGVGLVVSNEPDFISSIPLVKWGREVWKKYKK